MESLSRMPLPVRAVLGSLALVMAAFALDLATGAIPADASDLFQKFASNAVFIGSALVCCWRSLAVREERLAWALFGAGLLAWGLGDLYFTLALWDLDEIPVPSLADAGYLALYPLVFTGLALLVTIASKSSIAASAATASAAMTASTHRIRLIATTRARTSSASPVKTSGYNAR